MRKIILISLAIIIAVVIGYNVVISALFPLKFKQQILNASQVNNVSPALVASLIRAESNFNPNSVSSKGAIGLMQIMPSTAEFVADKIGIDDFDLFDPIVNINIGTYYLKYLLNKFEDINTALFAYNAGEGNVSKWLKDGNVNTLQTSPYRQSNAYVQKINTAIPFYKGKLG